jgi:tripartite-type tricarboxylate transporter receptor subunit TctC
LLTGVQRENEMNLGKIIISVVLGVATGIACAQNFPAKPITFISPFPPGGGTDQITRLMATTVGAQTGWATVVENKPGAGGNLALDTVARAQPDGYTLVMAQTDNVVLNPWLFEKLPYDTFKDFTYIGLVASSPSVFVVTPDSPFKTINDVVVAAKKAPGTITLGIPGAGGTGDLLGYLWRKAANMTLTHVPYRGWAQAYPDLVSKRIDLYTGSVASLLGQIQAGKVRALAVVGPQRSHALPEVPTFVESGFQEINQEIWWGLLAPANTNASIIASLNSQINKALKDPETIKKLQLAGYQPLGGTPEEMSKRYKLDYDLFGKIIRDAGIKLSD